MERQNDVQQISDLVQDAQAKFAKELQSVKALTEALNKGVREDVALSVNETREDLL